ncbi:polymer-forming cytoskeletal protein, partial [Patescibacteria group bacterium]|nr:polymer-forming cytoskeletal protein [Patescibacteria group bacterium]
KKYIYSIFISVFLISITFGSAQAADFRIADKEGGNINVGQEEEITSLYAAGNIVSIEADTEKGLHVAGNIVNINGAVGHSVYSGAGTLIVRGDIGGSIHGGAGNIVIESNVEGDVILGGGNISIADKASIGGDLVVGGGVVDIQGSVGGNIYLSGGVLTINGEVGGDVKIDQVDELKIGSNAVINGNLEYYSVEEIEIEEGAVILGETILNEAGINKDIDKGALAGIIFAFISLTLLIKLVGVTLTSLIIFFIFKRFTKNVVTENLSSFWKNLGLGFALLILIPIASIMIIATIVGIWLGLIILMIYLVSLMLATVFASITFGSWLSSLITKEEKHSITWKTIIGGVIALMAVDFIPVIGGVIVFVFILSSFGAIYKVAFKLHR